MYYEQSICRCSKLGEELRREEERQHALKMEGFNVYQQYIKEGAEAFATKKVLALIFFIVNHVTQL